MDERKFLGVRVKELRRSRGLSQERLAEQMGITPNYLSSIERGRENPTLELLTNLASALKVELVALFNYPWEKMTAAELKRKLHALVDRADLDHLREVFALMKAREL